MSLSVASWFQSLPLPRFTPGSNLNPCPEFGVHYTEEQGHPPHQDLSEDSEHSEEQIQDAWFANLATRGDPILLDRAEEVPSRP